MTTPWQEVITLSENSRSLLENPSLRKRYTDALDSYFSTPTGQKTFDLLKETQAKTGQKMELSADRGKETTLPFDREGYRLVVDWLDQDLTQYPTDQIIAEALGNAGQEIRNNPQYLGYLTQRQKLTQLNEQHKAEETELYKKEKIGREPNGGIRDKDLAKFQKAEEKFNQLWQRQAEEVQTLNDQLKETFTISEALHPQDAQKKAWEEAKQYMQEKGTPVKFERQGAVTPKYDLQGLDEALKTGLAKLQIEQTNGPTGRPSVADHRPPTQPFHTPT